MTSASETKSFARRLWSALTAPPAPDPHRLGRCLACDGTLAKPEKTLGHVFKDSPDVDAFHDAARRADLAALGQWWDWNEDPDLWTAKLQHCPACSARYLSVWCDPPGLFRSALPMYAVPLSDGAER